jgi:hypothetical protein
LAYNRSKSIPVESSPGFSTHENIFTRSGGHLAHVAQSQQHLIFIFFTVNYTVNVNVNFTVSVSYEHFSHIQSHFLVNVNRVNVNVNFRASVNDNSFFFPLMTDLAPLAVWHT